MALAPTKFSSLTPAGTLDGTEIIAASQVVSGTLTSVKTTASAIAALAVSGPTSATDGNVAVFDGTTGKLIKDGGAPLVNPMTTAGDMIVGGTSGAASRFAAPTTGTNWTLTYVIGTGYVWSSSAATVAWGGITGTLSDQTDLQAALDAKAGLASANVYTRQQAITPYRANISGAVSIDLAATAHSNNLHLTLTGNVSSFALTNPVNGAVYNIRFIQDSTGSRTITLPSAFKFAGGTAPTFSTAANAVDFMSAEYGSTEGTYMASFLKGMS